MLQPGFAIIHSNQLEQLRELLVSWMQSHPLPVLAQEEILVQSNGIAQWLKMALADDAHQGIAAGLQVDLPNKFVWRLYRAVLGENIPKSLPYDKQNLAWRIQRLLPSLTSPVYQPIQSYLAGDEDQRRAYELAQRLADLYDQYQVYRADWLQLWSANLGGEVDQIRRNNNTLTEVPPEQRWQPALWRALREDMEAKAAPSQFSSRADVHQLALNGLAAGEFKHPELLPERVIVFGISTLPAQTIELLAELGQHRQVLLAVLNPCQHFWGDITLLQDEIRRQQKRQQRKPGLPEEIEIDDLHLHAPPLLAALGKQARDYISLLDEFDEPERYREWFNGRIDLFNAPDGEHMLAQLQTDILELNPVTQRAALAGDTSVSFHIAHSRQREVEVLQDQLIADFAAEPSLNPRDCIVMVPDIAKYAPLIQASFGRIDKQDPRYLPFDLADQKARGEQPLLLALEYLLNLPEQRLTVSEVLDLIEVPAVANRFGMNLDAIGAVRSWLLEAGARWGLDGEQRQQLDMPAMADAFSFAYAVKRLLLGYAMSDDQAWQNVLPFDNLGGLAAAELGPILTLIEQLKVWLDTLNGGERSPEQWQELMVKDNGLLRRFFAAEEDDESRLILTLQNAAQQVLDACQAGHFEEPISLLVWREAWLNGVDQAGLSQKFLGGSITFSTLLPMRAVPFKRVYLLGMGDEDYPRQQPRDDFDLMANDYRPGDRSRRDDDRYLFLEAMLSARDSFYISWVGRSILDNTEKPASVLVNQLRDVISLGWGEEALASLTYVYPMQPFSKRYLSGDLATYASEWLQTHAAEQLESSSLADEQLSELELSISDVGRFLRCPADFYLAKRFNVFRPDDLDATDDDEPFIIDGLSKYQFSQHVFEQVLAGSNIGTQLDRLQQQALLPVQAAGELFRKELGREMTVVMKRLEGLSEAPPRRRAQPLEINLHDPATGLHVQDWLEDIYLLGDESTSRPVQFVVRSGAVLDKGQPKFYMLLNAYLRQLFANAHGVPLVTHVLGLDAGYWLTPVPATLAKAQICNWLGWLAKGLQQPLPCELRTGLVWLTTEAPGKAQGEYEGGYNSTGAVAKSLGLQRYFPDFNQLFGGDFEQLAEQLYGPLLSADWQEKQ
ncbi:exodeoxyribonuclease V subunit gamma [Salinibius halmophilus]|uniref:exodeoxyribonuclease V subunit gamma n=1 Tax=Salinibius halmophilus TaxID=1853216 RepID=UPI000E671C57|nr:exodeoxyribonuclease V subunit gamma [Salinibius halmophilus]